MKKYMTKKVRNIGLLSVTILIVIGCIYAVLHPKTAIEKAKIDKYSPKNLKLLESLGFLNSFPLERSGSYDKDINPERVEHYKNLCGLQYLSEQGLQKLCKAEGLIIASTDKYIGDIPSKNVDELELNLKKLEPFFEESFELTDVTYKRTGIFLSSNELTDMGKEKLRASEQGYYKDVAKNPIAQNSLLIFYGLNVVKYHPAELEKNILIVAPTDFIKKADSEEIVDFHLQAKKRVDPLIIKPIPDGYLILTQW